MKTYPDRVGQSKGDGQRQTLGDGYHQHRHTDDEVEHERLDVRGRLLCRPRFTLYGEFNHAEFDDQNQHHQNRHSGTWRSKNTTRYRTVLPLEEAFYLN